MFRHRTVRAAALGLTIYGVLGILIVIALGVVGSRTFDEVSSLQGTLDMQRVALAQSVRTASRTIGDSAATSVEVQRSIDAAQASANTASQLAFNTSLSFRELSRSLQLTIFGIQPLAGIAPQFDQSGDQLEQLAMSLGSTRDALGQSRTGVGRVGTDLVQLQRQLDSVALAVEQAGGLGTSPRQLLPFQVAFYGMCLLVILQSLFSLVAGIALFRLGQALGSGALFPHVVRVPAAAVPMGQPRSIRQP
jgi:hypothetical protein